MATVRIALADMARVPLPARSLSGGSDVAVVSVWPMWLWPGAVRIRLPFDRGVVRRLGWYVFMVRTQLVLIALCLIALVSFVVLTLLGDGAAALAPYALATSSVLAVTGLC